MRAALSGCCWTIVLTFAIAWAARPDSSAAPLFRLDLTLVDFPANAGPGAYWPTMAQTKSSTLAFCELSNSCVALAVSRIRNPFAQASATLGLEACALLVNAYLPFGVTWMHEEYHRAVLSNRGISSYDGVYDFNIDVTAISVSHVTDEALEQLKASHPEDLVRCEEAGYEGQIDLADGLLQDALMHGSRLVEPMALYALFSNSFYIWYNTSAEADEEIAEFNQRETTVAQRDIVGWDFSSWTYDLHRPSEAYAARGIHPGGVGINRYITWSQLSPSEQAYLRLQAALSLLNFARPQLYFAKPWRCGVFGEQADVTAGLRHCLTPFGFEAGAYAMARMRFGAVASVNVYANNNLALPGIDVSLLEIPLGSAASALLWSPRLSLWLQPRDERFDSRTAEPGLLTTQRLDVKLTGFTSAYAELEAKSGGWSAGTAELGGALLVRAGGTITF